MMSNKKIRKLLKKNQPNSGFTLTELLTGLIMSVIVTGALGFGLYQILTLTRTGSAKSNARNEASRAVEFISDEIRRARTLDTDFLMDTDRDAATPEEDLTPPGLPSGITVALALDIPELSGDAIVYYLRSNAGTDWRGPQVLYRFGPPLDATGNYTAGTWQSEALIDGIAAGGNVTCNGSSTPNPGFLACIDADQVSAQLFLTGGVDTIANNSNDADETYTSSTQTVARAKVADVNSAVTGATSPISFRSLDPGYVCDPNVTSVAGQEWMMRMDFDNNPYDPAQLNNSTTWIHEAGRQAQPVNISRNDPMDLTIYSSPIGRDACLSTGNSISDGFSANSPLSDITDPAGNGHAVSYNIEFQETVSGRSANPDFWTTFNGDTTSGHNNPNVTNDGTVMVLKNGSQLIPGASIDTTTNNTNVPAPLYAGYDFDGDGQPDKKSLGRFLYDQGYADPIGSFSPTGDYDDPVGGYEIKDLGADERIVAIEIGQTDNGTTVDDGTDGLRHPGFDLQDNIVVITNEIFDRDY